MRIDRHEYQGGKDVALKRISYCLEQLEKFGFKGNIGMGTLVSNYLTLEEVVGALVAAEQVIE